jgi:hypothetical protein
MAARMPGFFVVDEWLKELSMTTTCPQQQQMTKPLAA